MTSQAGSQKVSIHIMANIWRIKGNQTRKFGHLIEYNIKKIFVEKSYTKCVRDTIPRPFSKKSKFSISFNQSICQIDDYRIY